MSSHTTHRPSSLGNMPVNRAAKSRPTADQIYTDSRPASLLLTLGWASILISLMVVSFLSYRCYRAASTAAMIHDLGGNYQWEYEMTLPPNDSWGRFRESEFMQSISPVVSSIAKVEFDVEQLSDEHASVLKRLKNVRRLILRGDALSDETLNDIVHMQQLEHLTLDSAQVSVSGYLKLRELPKLRYLKIDMRGLAPIELAVLEAELSAVRFIDQPVQDQQRTVDGGLRPTSFHTQMYEASGPVS